MNIRTGVLAIIFIIFPLAVSSCGGKLYEVAPLPGRPPALSAGDADGLRIGARALDSDDAFESFSANLPLAGVMAVEIDLTNNSADSINLRKLRFYLSGGGAKFRRINSKKALSRVMDYYGVSFYRKDARKRTREDYQAVELNTSTPLGPQEERRGYIFFQTKSDSGFPADLVLDVNGHRDPVRVELK